MNLASFDPGKNCAGAGVYVAGLLVMATLIRGDGPLDVAQKVAQWFSQIRLVSTLSAIQYDALVTEGQQVYPGPRKNDPNDLFPLTFCCGAVHALVEAREKHSILPGKWTRGTPKDIRLARAEAALSPSEQKVLGAVKCPKSLRHNVVDAIALGRWFLDNQGKVS